MKLTILGCHAPYAPANSACSGYLVQSENFNLMLDCGHGSFAQLQNHINFWELNALVITHFHPDHYVDVHAMRHAFWGALQKQKRKDPLVVYAPSEPVEIFNKLNGWRDVFITIPLEDAVLRPNHFGSTKLKFFSVNHPLPTYGVRIEAKEKVFAYTSDTAWGQNLITACQGTDLLLAEASFREADIVHTKKGHMTAKQAGSLAQLIESETLILTHFWPDYNADQLQREAEVAFDGKVELARVGKSFIL